MQLRNFAKAIKKHAKLSKAPSFENWFDAFDALEEYLENINEDRKKTIFIDEMPWIDTQKSDFVSALENFWNGWANRRTDIVFIASGSATSWMADNLEENQGGLHGRITARIYLQPFNLRETEEYLETMSSFMSDEIIGQKKLIRDFSAGNKQKIGIIGSMLNRPQLLMLDEPFNFLDPSSQNILKKILKNYCEETHATILVSSHNLQHTVEVSNRVLLMEHGLIIKDIDNTNGLAEKELENYFNV